MRKRKQFWLGVLFSSAVLGLWQDILGEEAFLELISVTWLGVHWAIWLAVAVIVYGFSEYCYSSEERRAYGR